MKTAEEQQNIKEGSLAVGPDGVTDEVARQIRIYYAKGHTQEDLVQKFKVSQCTISDIVRGKRHKNAGGPIITDRKGGNHSKFSRNHKLERPMIELLRKIYLRKLTKTEIDRFNTDFSKHMSFEELAKKYLLTVKAAETLANTGKYVITCEDLAHDFKISLQTTRDIVSNMKWHDIGVQSEPESIMFV